ncbi:carbohydrate binding domain-containing protein [Terrimicrobium sacchariphilum]|uniref:Carbohydrate binding domain-containing protein n=1 Tax=Terrimicrobium sacchariphilum TaxID=690879 RepID=A0A146GG73_TERSA|nr:carbohydrate binding domain-containing protein [Terrimicrobium sacchariphilum]GAT35448.1 carbohydrate binding domain-containing protein [Terrimicrobium sacchariphilum]
MKLNAAFLAALAIGCCCHAADPVEMLIDNGGFESGLDGWTLRVGEGAVAAPEAAHGGQAGLRIPTTVKMSIQAASVPVDCGKRYRISLWVRGIGSIPMSLNLGWRNDSGKYMEVQNPNDFKLALPVGSEWQHFTREFVPPDGAASLQVGFSTWLPPGKTSATPIDVDEVVLEEIGEAN